MYPNLKAEMARRGFTLESMAKCIGVTTGTLSLKLNGKTKINLNEAKTIKTTLETDLSLEELFKETE